jgi:hypothetical protein
MSQDEAKAKKIKNPDEYSSGFNNNHNNEKLLL